MCCQSALLLLLSIYYFINYLIFWVLFLTISDRISSPCKDVEPDLGNLWLLIIADLLSERRKGSPPKLPAALIDE